LVEGKDLLAEIENLHKQIKSLKDDYYWEIYREIEERIITENGGKVIYSSPTA
jgi:hypothetical protein